MSMADISDQLSVYEVLFAIWKMIAWRVDRRRKLKRRELQEIGELASNPTDNLRLATFAAARNVDEFKLLWRLVYRNYLRTNRPWYRHPRWHVHHWRIEVPALREWLTRTRLPKGIKAGQTYYATSPCGTFKVRVGGRESAPINFDAPFEEINADERQKRRPRRVKDPLPRRQNRVRARLGVEKSPETAINEWRANRRPIPKPGDKKSQ